NGAVTRQRTRTKAPTVVATATASSKACSSTATAYPPTGTLTNSRTKEVRQGVRSPTEPGTNCNRSDNTTTSTTTTPVVTARTNRSSSGTPAAATTSGTAHNARTAPKVPTPQQVKVANALAEGPHNRFRALTVRCSCPVFAAGGFPVAEIGRASCRERVEAG